MSWRTVMIKFWNHETGPKTTHFWGPVMNWGFVLAGIMNMNKPPEMISRNMTCGILYIVLIVYSSMFARFAWMVRPRNYLLLGCHVSNIAVQSKLLQIKLTAPASQV